MKKLLLFISLLGCMFALSCMAQVNLVPNPSFEAYPNVSTQFCFCGPISSRWGGAVTDTFYLSPPWYSPTSGSPDCFKPCSPLDNYKVPKNQFGYQWPRTGDGYAFISTKVYYPFYEKDYREYLQVKLLQPLIQGKSYYVEFYVSCIDSANHAPDRIGLYISDTIVYLLFNVATVLNFIPQIDNPEYNYITNKTDWIKISGEYVAQGGEQYITIGNFYDDDHTYDTTLNTGKPGLPTSGLFVDDVSVVLIEEPIPELEPVVFIPNMFSPNADGHNDVFYVRGENIKALHLQIYNRWGEKLFESTEPSHGWDGTHKSKKCADGVYYYVAEITFGNGETVSRKGNVTLLR